MRMFSSRSEGERVRLVWAGTEFMPALLIKCVILAVPRVLEASLAKDWMEVRSPVSQCRMWVDLEEALCRSIRSLEGERTQARMVLEVSRASCRTNSRPMPLLAPEEG